MRFRIGALGALTVWCIFSGYAGAATATPEDVRATIQSDPSGIFLQWSPVEGATEYRVRTYRNLDSQQADSTLSTSNTARLFELPCGFSFYFSVEAVGPEGNSPHSPRVFGQSPDCPYAVPNCDYPAVAVSGSGVYTGSTLFHFNDYRIGDKEGPCDDGNDPGTAGVGRDVVYRYRSVVDCTLTVSLSPDDLEYNPILYVADSCEERRCLQYSNTFFAQPEVITFEVTAGQDYFVFVDGYAADDSGGYEITFTTDDCLPEQACGVLQEGFSEGGLPQGWSSINTDSIADADGGRYAPQAWGVMEDLTGPLYNRVSAAYADPAVNENTEDWLVSGPISLGEDAVLRWRDARLGDTGSIFLFNVYVGASPDLPSLQAGGPLLTLNRDALTSSFTQREISLAANGFMNQTVYVGFYHFARGTGYLFVDDVGVCDTTLVRHSADQNGDGKLGMSELLRAIQLYNADGYHCVQAPNTTEDGFVPSDNSALRGCVPHAGDYNPQDWRLNLSELLRLIQFFNTDGLYSCDSSDDGFCPGAP